VEFRSLNSPAGCQAKQVKQQATRLLLKERAVDETVNTELHAPAGCPALHNPALRQPIYLLLLLLLLLNTLHTGHNNHM
jgi:hypothetical protein